MAPPIVTASIVGSIPGVATNPAGAGSSSGFVVASTGGHPSGRGLTITEDTLRLIECVKARPALWHRKHLRQRVQVAHRGWEEIRKAFKATDVVSLKVRWKTLRDSFRREVKRIEDGELTTSSWPLFDRMSFLIGHFRTRESYCKGGSISPEQSKSAEDEHWQYFDDKRESIAEEVVVVGGDDLEVVETLSIFPKHGRYESISAAGGASSIVGESDPEEVAVIGELKNTSQGEPYGDVEMETARSCEVIEIPPELYGEVTFKNKLRARIKSEPVDTDQLKAGNRAIESDADYNFLMSLHPFMKQLSGKKNLSVRIKIQQLIAEAMD
ncbi:uncharacterized protein LOC131690210 [Topomyia yanbarensis]|uniref:uncharacterized protein LOC131690210 n=1 Tax=Topomyia yanbarensis TaxID=2498891 RepID=UPI00273BCB40|nr:uncharacterized protein LOC131690210 [Topomyia yanbarensis]